MINMNYRIIKMVKKVGGMISIGDMQEVEKDRETDITFFSFWLKSSMMTYGPMKRKGN